ncbi:MAG: hypothetical protein LRY55_15155 [Leadbetterella sp.]|nr:hypothetical protein [Leadbetterella sp.]
MKTKLWFTLAFLASLALTASGQGYDRNYRLLSSGDLTADKNFYLLTVIDKNARGKSNTGRQYPPQQFSAKESGGIESPRDGYLLLSFLPVK